MAIIVIMSLALSREISQTETELRRYQDRLEMLVSERTTELSHSNEQLIKEIERRKQAEFVLRESEETARALLNAPTDAAALLDPTGIVLDANEAMAHQYDTGLDEFISTNIWDSMPPEVAERRQAIVQQVMSSGQSIRFEDVRNGSWNDSVIYPVFNAQGQVTKVAVMAHDITERKQAEQTLNRRVEELAILHETAQTVASVTDLTPALQQVCETLNYLFAARYTHTLMPAPDETGLEVIGFEQEVGPIGPTPLDIPLTEVPMIDEALSRGQSMVIADVQSQPLDPMIREYIVSRNLQSILLVPLLTHGDTLGIIVIATDQIEREFTTGEISLAETIAVDIAAAVENSLLLAQAKDAAAVEERNRIARELHDSVTQTMYSVSIVAEALPRMLERNLDEAKRNAGYLRQTTLGALAEMRTLLFELRPDSLAKIRLNVLLQQLADALTGRTRVPVEITIEGQLSLPTEVKIALYRIAQETFNNINKHADATRAWAILHREPDRVILAIRDNGRGFDPASVPEERLGLRIMRERAANIGANLTLESAPGHGVQLTVTWTDPADQFVTEREHNT